MLEPGSTFWDIGANIGFYTLLASRRVGAQGRVVAFEPTPATVARLRQHVTQNDCANVTVLPCALGHAPGEQTVYALDHANHGMNSLRDRPVVVSDAAFLREPGQFGLEHAGNYAFVPRG